MIAAKNIANASCIHMKRRSLRTLSILLLLVLLFSLLVKPVRATSHTFQHPAIHHGTTLLNAVIYLPTSTLQSIFQKHIDQLVPVAFNKSIADMVDKVPPANQNWVSQMTTALLQPSGAITQLAPQTNGLATTLRISLYNGDPRPVDVHMLVTFTALDASTIQVSAQPVAGSPTLVNGPLTTFQPPVGQVSSITTTPTCGSSALAMHLQLPLPQSGSTNQSVAQSTAPATTMRQATPAPFVAPTPLNAYVEVGSASLASLGPSFGSVPINGTLSAQNIRISVQGSNIVIVSDIMLGLIPLGTATTTLQPQAVGGNLSAHVLKTTLSLFQIFS